MPKPFLRRDMEPDELRKHISATYVSLRMGIAALGVAFPWILGIGGYLWAHLCLQNSMSAYYHASVFHGRSMRDIFVGVLFTVGVFLYLYKGWGDLENYLLDAAGAFAIGIAIFPMKWTDCDLRTCGPLMPCPGQAFSVHGFCAISFFFCIAMVCFFCAGDTLPLIPDEQLQNTYKARYKVIGFIMIASMVGAYFLNTVIQSGRWEFWVEFTGITSFGAYWYQKTIELKKSDAERQALRGELKRRKGQIERGLVPAPPVR